MKLSNFEPTYRLDYGGGADLAWKTLTNVTLGTGLYVGVNFEVRMLDAQNNWGISSDARLLRYYVYMARSGGVQDDADSAAVSGPIANYVRVVRTSLGHFELQIRQIQNWQRLKFEVTAYAINSLGSGGSVAYVDNPSNGSESDRIYNPTTTHTDYLSNLTVNGVGNIGGVKLLNNGNTDPGNVGPSVQTNTAALYLEPSPGDWVTAAFRRGKGLLVGWGGGDGTLSASGNVGIGTTTPGARLEILHDNNEYLLGFKDTHANGTQWSFVNGATYTYGGGFQGDLIIGTGQPGTTFAHRMTLQPGGNVGIGTVQPGSPLDVNGVIRNSAANGFSIGNDVGQNRLLNSGSIFQFLTNANTAAPAQIGGLAITSNYGNLPPSTGLFVEGSVGIGSTNPGTYKLDVNGTVNASGFNLNGSPLSGSQWSNGSGNINYAGGNVGVGTTSPATTLDVNGQSTFRGTISVLTNEIQPTDNSALLGDSSHRFNSAFIGDGGLSVGFAATAPPTQGIAVLGNVGIGTASPQGKLHVANGTTGTGILIDGFTPATNPTIANNAGNEVTFRGSGGNTANGIAYNFVRFDTAASFLAITNSGNVGIGTMSPGDKLEVNGNIRFTDNVPDSLLKRSDVVRNLIKTSRTDDTQVGQFRTNGWGDFTVDRSFAVGYDLSEHTGYGAGSLLVAGSMGLGTRSPTSWGAFAVRTSASLNGKNVSASLSDGIYSTFDVRHPVNNVVDLSSQNSALTFSTTTNSTDGIERMRIDTSGNVGIGKSAETGYKLDVAGNINATQTITGTNIVAKYQDVAEWVPASEQLSAGTVVVLDSNKANQVTSSTVSYDTRVAGVVSEQPGIALGEKSGNKVLVATTGRVRVKVDATKGAIHIGDLLVTSDVPGVAMKSEPVEFAGRKMHMPGTIIGKAQEPLEKGKGEIVVLLSLQ
jgi:hypothetical protein